MENNYQNQFSNKNYNEHPKEIPNPTISNNSRDSVINMTAFLPTLPNEDCYYLYRLSKTVRLLSIIDFTFGLLMFFFGYIGFYIVFRLLWQRHS